MSSRIEFGGIPFVIDDRLGEEIRSVQVRFPRSKKRRIQRKWAKNPRNHRQYRIQKPIAYQCFREYEVRIIANSAAMSSLRSMIGGRS